MSDRFSQTSAHSISGQNGFDEAALAHWMTANISGFTGPMTVERFQGGQSNPTYRLTTPTRSYVMRRKPSGRLVEGAHAIEREARVMSALRLANFPTPHVYGLCSDETIIGAPFFVMEMVEGRIFWNASLPEVPREERRQYYEAMAATLASLHGIDHQELGLSDYGRPNHYVERQIRRWSRQYLADTPEAGRDDGLEKLIEWLPAHMPDDEQAAIAHGDFRIDNLIFHPRKPQVLAVLDWELSTIGHPIADFAYSLMTYRLPATVIAGLADTDLKSQGIPSETEYVKQYCDQRGISVPENLDYYIAFNLFRLAAIVHGIKGRLARGNAASSHAQRLVEALPIISGIGKGLILEHRR